MVLVLFVLCLMLPGFFFIGDLRLSPARLLLLIVFVPLLIRLVSGGVGRLRAPDVLLMLFMLWMLVTLIFHHGLERLPYAMISVVELLGGYLIGRTLIRSEADFVLFFRTVFWALLALTPFVVLEFLTDRNLLQEVSRQVMPTFFKGESSSGRLGLNRVMAGFEHPIHYGLFCAAVFGPLVAIFGRKGFRQIALVLFLGFMTFASLSSAPLLALAIQIALMAWAWMTGGRWRFLAVSAATLYVLVDVLSNRSPVTILINHITFDPNTAWTRINTWEFGSAEMWRHPIFGIGLNEWVRPRWLTPSVDNFWLLNGMRHGVVGAVLMIAALAASFWSVMAAPGLAKDTANWRRGYLFSVFAVYMTLGTVHIWGGLSSFVLLLVGAGMWFCDAGNRAHLEPSAPDPKTRKVASGAYSRFPIRYKRPPKAPEMAVCQDFDMRRSNFDVDIVNNRSGIGMSRSRSRGPDRKVQE